MSAGKYRTNIKINNDNEQNKIWWLTCQRNWSESESMNYQSKFITYRLVNITCHHWCTYFLKIKRELNKVLFIIEYRQLIFMDII